jgi:hypothetical protein
MRKIRIVLAVVLIVVAVLAVTKNMIAQTALVKGLEAVTGLEVRIKQTDIGFLRAVLRVNDLRVFNPASFKDRILADFPEIYGQVNLPDYFKGKIHLIAVRVNLKELDVIRNEKKELNINALKMMQKGGGGGKGTGEGGGKGAGEGNAPALQIDDLNLKIGKVVFKDLSVPDTNSRAFNVNIDEHVQNIAEQDPRMLVRWILARALSQTAVPGLAGIDMKALEGQMSDFFKKQTGTMMQQMQKAPDVIKGKAQ